MQRMFSDLLRGATAGTYSDLDRAGTQAQAGHTLQAQIGQSQVLDAIMRLLAQIYAINLGGDAQRNLLGTRMSQVLA
jgi:hypothetical protein